MSSTERNPVTSTTVVATKWGMWIQHQLATELKRHEDAVYTYFRRMGRQPADAADLTQDTFVRALVGVQ